MKVTAKVAFRLAAYLGIAGLTYLLTAYEWAGGLLVLLAAVAFAYVGVVLRGAAREAGPSAPAGGEDIIAADEAHVGPTIWPFVFSLAAALLVLGIVVQRWLLVAGAAVFVASALGWFADVRRQHAHAPSGKLGKEPPTP